MKTQDLLPRRSPRARDARREPGTAPATGSREGAARPGWLAGASRGVHLPSLVQLAFTDPLPSDYYLG